MLGKLAARLWTLLIVLPLAIVLIVFAVANRQPVQISLDPIAEQTPWFAVTVPLFVGLFVSLIVGVLIGGVAVWFTQGRMRKQARENKLQATKLARERDVQKEQLNKLSGARALPSPASLR